MTAKQPSNIVNCDLCGAKFTLTKGILEEQDINLMREGFPDHPVKATFLTCPHCGKRYPVVVDDTTTLPLLEELRAVYGKIVKYTENHKTVPERLKARYRKVNLKLDFNRHKLAAKYKTSCYQLEDGTMEQLDYCYHEQNRG